MGPDHPDILSTRHEIARMIAARGKPADAETEFRQVLDARRRLQGPDHPDTLATRRLARSPSTPRPKPTVYRPLRVTP